MYTAPGIHDSKKISSSFPLAALNRQVFVNLLNILRIRGRDLQLGDFQEGDGLMGLADGRRRYPQLIDFFIIRTRVKRVTARLTPKRGAVKEEMLTRPHLIMIPALNNVHAIRMNLVNETMCFIDPARPVSRPLKT